MIKTLIQTFINYYKANKLIKKYAKKGLTDDQIVYKCTVDLIREQFEFFGIDTTKMRDVEITEGFKTVAKIVASGVSFEELKQKLNLTK